MIKRMGMAAAAALFAFTAAAAGAQAFNGAGKIVQGNYAAAERDLVAQRGLYPDAVDLTLNLAAVYAATGRPVAARRLYEQVSAQPDEEVMVRNGVVAWSHALAAQGMARMPAVVASR